MEHPFIQELLELILPPQDGYRPHITSRFASTNRPPRSTNPHRGLDANYYLGPKANPQSGLNLDHPTVQSPVAGDIEEIEPSLGRIVIREKDPASNYTGYRVEILHTNTRSVKEKDQVSAGQPIATMGGVGVNGKGRPEGFQHMHVQVIDPAGNVINPLRHLFEYHHLRRTDTVLASIRAAAIGAAHATRLGFTVRKSRRAGAERRAAISGRSSTSSSDRSAPERRKESTSTTRPDHAAGSPSTDSTVSSRHRAAAGLAPGTANPGAAGPAPAPDGLPPLHFAPETPQRFGPFEVPGLFRRDDAGSPPLAPAADGTPANPSILPTPSFAAPSLSSPATSPAPGMAGQIGDGNGIGHWWNGLVTDVDAVSRRNGFGGLSIPMPNNLPTPPTQTVFDRGLPGMLQRAGAFDPSAGGLLGWLQELERHHPDDDDASA